MEIKKLLVLLIFAVAIIGIIAPVNAAISSENKVYSIESKEKAVKYKVTWNGNGGKIGSKKTTVSYVKKGSKVGKLATPKRSGYTFKGWYTKKSGGTKITKNTKPKKSVTYFAQWKKKSSRVLNAEEKKLVGIWGSQWDGKIVFKFNDDGTFSQVSSMTYWDDGMQGNYSLKNGVLTWTYYSSTDRGFGWGPWKWQGTSKHEGDRGVKFSTINGKPAFTYSLYRQSNMWFIKDRI